MHWLPIRGDPHCFAAAILTDFIVLIIDLLVILVSMWFSRWCDNVESEVAAKAHHVEILAEKTQRRHERCK